MIYVVLFTFVDNGGIHRIDDMLQKENAGYITLSFYDAKDSVECMHLGDHKSYDSEEMNMYASE